MASWCEEAKLLDKVLLIADIDRCFIAANLDDIEKTGATTSTNDGSSENRLCRYKFLEILVRIADQKYRRPKIVSTFSEALKRLLDCIYTNYKAAELFPW